MSDAPFSYLNGVSPYFKLDAQGSLQVAHGTLLEQETAFFDILAKARIAGAGLPTLLHFKHILQHRVSMLYQTFAQQCRQLDYQGQYQLAFPIKVNPASHILETLAEYGEHYQIPLGFEVGTKSELLAVLSVVQAGSKIICNGFKDEHYYQLANLAASLGHDVVIVLEHSQELELLAQLIEAECTVHFKIGLRIKPFLNDIHAQKFGLSLHSIGKVRHYLESIKHGHLVTLLHGHIGSQIEDESLLDQHIQFMMRLYADLQEAFPQLNTIDFGGGLSVDYQGSNHDLMHFDFYAHKLVSQCQYYAKHYQTKEPHIITESGRAVTAHCEVLLIDPLYASTEQVVTPSDSQKTLNQQWLAGEITLTQYLNDSERQFVGTQRTMWLNFSLFQSLPDQWGINQQFPMASIHQQGSEVESAEKVVLFDISCDVDGVITNSDKNTNLALSLQPNVPIAIFLVGAYQNMLSSKHNLMGLLPRVFVNFEPDGQTVLELCEAESNYHILTQYGFNPLRLMTKLRSLLAAKSHETTDYPIGLDLLERLMQHSPYLNLSTFEEQKHVQTLAG